MLLDTDGLGHYQARAAESGVATGDGGRHHSEQRQYATEHAKPIGTNKLHDLGRREELYKRLASVGLGHELLYHVGRHNLAPTAIIEEIH